jgi:hypothetical protein
MDRLGPAVIVGQLDPLLLCLELLSSGQLLDEEELGSLCCRGCRL